MIYGIHQGNILYAGHAVNGKDCMAVCPYCGRELIAVNREGNKARPYYRHKPVKKKELPTEQQELF